jgi:hypothetical protein
LRQDRRVLRGKCVDQCVPPYFFGGGFNVAITIAE